LCMLAPNGEVAVRTPANPSNQQEGKRDLQHSE
jgi:hypothetical protein